jgi:hypothetical protein
VSGSSLAAGHSRQGGRQEQQQNKDEPSDKNAGSFDAAAVIQEATSNASGGTRRIVASDSSDAKQIGLIRSSLKALADAFDGAVFGVAVSEQKIAPQALTALQSATPGKLQVQYLEIRGGAELRYSSADPALVGPLQTWVRAQLPDPKTPLASAPSLAMPTRPQ